MFYTELKKMAPAGGLSLLLDDEETSTWTAGIKMRIRIFIAG